MLILWNFEVASFNSFSRYFFPSLVAHFSTFGFDGCLRWFVCALSTEGGWLAPEDCEGPLLPRRLVGVEEEWLVCQLCLLEAIVSCQGSLVGALLISGYDICAKEVDCGGGRGGRWRGLMTVL